MLGLGTLRRVAGELRRDVAAAQERDPAALGVSAVEILGGLKQGDKIVIAGSETFENAARVSINN